MTGAIVFAIARALCARLPTLWPVGLGAYAMTAKQIEARMNAEQKRVVIKHETAIRIRELLDKARIAYGAQDWDDEDLTSIVLELVTEEGE